MDSLHLLNDSVSQYGKGQQQQNDGRGWGGLEKDNLHSTHKFYQTAGVYFRWRWACGQIILSVLIYGDIFLAR